DAWRTAFEARGVEILRYVPTNAFLVRGTPEALRGLATLPFVDGIGPFDAAWKVRPGTNGVGVVDVRIVVLPGESTDVVLADLSRRGVPRADPTAAGPGVLGTFGSGDFRWVRARVPAGLIPEIAARPDVEFIEPVRSVRPLNAETAWVLQTNATNNVRYWANGLDGRGQVVAISDTGVDYDHAAFRESAGEIVLGGGDLYNDTSSARRKVVRYLNMGVLTGQVAWPGGGTWDPWSIQDSDHTPTGGDCTFGHGTAVASVLTGNDNWLGGGGDPDDGLALGAKLYVQDIGTVGPDASSGCSGDLDLLTYIPEDLADLFGPAGLGYNDPAAPVRIHSNSWGSDMNEYDVQARMVDAFVWSHPDFTILFASGNRGSATSSVDAPATAKNLVTVGGVGNPDGGLLLGGDQDDVAPLSSRGPASDGRRKPTIMGIFDGDSAMSDGSASSGTGGSDDHWQGTSYATPSAAAAAAIVRQYFVDGWYPAARPVAGNGRAPSAALVRAILIASGSQVTGSGAFRPGQDTWPNHEQGFGRVQLSNVLPIAPGDAFRTRVLDGTSGLLTGDAYRETFRVSGPSTVKVVLAWTDFPAALGAGTALVNDLNLEVTAPDGTVYLGNNFGTFAQGRSIAGGTFDARNVEEAVILKSPLAGAWTVRVIGWNVPVGPQPFALVVTGGIDPAFGRVALDRPTYAPGDTVLLEVEDADAGAVQVRVTSGFDAAGETVSLARGGPDETWRGSVALSFGPTTEPGVQVRDGDVLQASYTDASPAHTAVAAARVDAFGPTVFDVVADRPGATAARITWRTDEPSTTGVRYGTAPTALSASSESTDLRTVHDATLAGLQPDTTYFYDVVARDRHDQETRDTNAGRHYRFRTEAFGDLLLVIGDDSFPTAREATWANALDANGWTWSRWRNEDAGLPPLGVLQAHRAVLWQVGLEQYPPFDAAERDLVKRYVDGGGRLLVSSHDTAWALADTSSQFFSL
ncbi:MAG: S8 family serine peptidase, partial [Methanobacteriota archaeon]